MALGWSGSNGGITGNRIPISPGDLCDYPTFRRNYPYPKEISYFINNICNLSCKHCYVAYNDDKDALSVDEWKEVFNELISMGALTFGNVGREPTLTWDKTVDLFLYFREKRYSEPRLRFGFVNNGIMIDEDKIQDLDRIQPDYIDISLDGTKKTHDYIRGSGVYDRVMKNLQVMSQYEIIEKVFISFTANKLNISTISELVDILYNLGVKNILISPYVTLHKRDGLHLIDEEFVKWTEKLIAGDVIDFSRYHKLNIYMKNDFMTTRNLMEELACKKIIDKDNLFVDDYGVIFNQYTFNGANVYFNYLPWDDFLVRAIRISHDGYVSNCFDMFFPNYPQRAIGNVRKSSISKILQRDTALLAVGSS
ncbi:MAG: radical SAM protein [Dehalococcoidia bacterium]|nr:radical SAM protein [Dehalococcoidia bacterium]